MNIRSFQNINPHIDPSAYIDPAAMVIGEVNIGADTSVWPMAVIRGDVNHIRIGARNSIQDGSILHVTHKREQNPTGQPLIIGDDNTIGHRVTLHGCTVHDLCLIGMGSIIMDGVVLESEVILGAGSLVTENKILESGYLYMGTPVKKIRPLTAEEREFLPYSAQHYVKVKNQY